MYKRELKVLPSDASCTGIIKLRNLLDYFQDTAALAVDKIEGTSTELASRGYSWILRNYEIEFFETPPVLDNKFTIYTAHDPNHGFNCLRIFKVVNSFDNIIIYAKSSWLLLDLAAQRPVKPIAHLPEITTQDVLEINPDFQEIPQSNNENNENNENNQEIIINREVLFHDLDINGHVNNAAYFEWIFESTPLDLMTNKLKLINASFRSGIKWRDKVEIRISKHENGFLYRVMNLSQPNKHKPSAEFFCVWQPKEEE